MCSQQKQRHKLCLLADLPDGSARGFDIDGRGQDTLFLVKNNGKCYGYLNACPHWEEAPMSWRKNAYLNADGSRIICHGHGAQFTIETGICVSGPCLGQALVPVPLSLDEHGVIEASL